MICAPGISPISSRQYASISDALYNLNSLADNSILTSPKCEPLDDDCGPPGPPRPEKGVDPTLAEILRNIDSLFDSIPPSNLFLVFSAIVNM